MAGRLAGQAPRRGQPAAGRVFAGNHGVVAQGVSPYPRRSRGRWWRTSRPAAPRSTRSARPTTSASRCSTSPSTSRPATSPWRPALDEKGCAATMAFGMEAIAGGTDLLVPRRDGHRQHDHRRGDLRTRSMAATRRDWVGRGTGVDDAGLTRKAAAVRARRHGPRRPSRRPARSAAPPRRARDRRHGRRHPRGAHATACRWSSTAMSSRAAAAVLHALDPAALDHCLAGHVSAEGAHREVLERIGKAPLLDLGMRLGEGSGAALAVGVVKAAARLPRRHGDVRARPASTTGRTPARAPDQAAARRAVRGAGRAAPRRFAHGARAHPSPATAGRWRSPRCLRAAWSAGSNLPPCMSIRPLTIGRPRPVPCSAVLIASEPGRRRQHDRDLLLRNARARCRGR